MTENQPSQDDFADPGQRARRRAEPDDTTAPGMASFPQVARALHEQQAHPTDVETQYGESGPPQKDRDTSRAQNLDLYDLAPVGYFTLSENGLILEVNAKGASLLGVARSDLIEQPLTRFVFPEDQDIYYRHRRELCATGAPQGCELRGVKNDATVFWMRLDAIVVRDDEMGAPVHRTVMSDITDRVQAQETLRKSEERLRWQIENTPLAVIEWGPDSRLSRWSSEAERIFGWRAEEVLGKRLDEFRWVYDEDVQHVARLAAGLLGGSCRRCVSHNRNYRKDGSVVQCEWYNSSLTDEAGNLRSVLSLVLDVTERERAVQALRESLAEKEILWHELHHRVKNNLAAIIGLIDMQRLSMDDSSAKGALRELACRIKSMAMIHEQLQVSEGLSRVDFSAYIQTLISHLLDVFTASGNIHIRVPAAGTKMDLQIAIPCGLIVTELVSNAIKYAFPGGHPSPGHDTCEIAVSIQLKGSLFTLAVADNGVGLPAGLDWMNTKTLGLQLVRLLGQHQLGGQIELHRMGGTKFVVSFRSRRKRLPRGRRAHSDR